MRDAGEAWMGEGLRLLLLLDGFPSSGNRDSGVIINAALAKGVFLCGVGNGSRRFQM